MAETGSHRLLLLGLDGGDLDFIRSRASELPTLRDALKRGSLFNPHSPKALSGSVWPTFYSGSNPGVHGIYQHLVWDPGRMGLRRIGPDWCEYKPFWKALEERGHRVVVLDVPYSFPVSLRRGIEITDWATHGQTWPLASNRSEVASTIRRLGQSPMGRETPVRKTAKQMQNIRRRLIESAALKGRLVRQLMRDLDWDLFIVVFAEVHRGGHILFGDGDDREPRSESTPLLDVYRAVDTALARILEGIDQRTTVLIFSVHGMMRNYAQSHLVPRLIRRINDVFLERWCGISAAWPRPGGIVRRLRGVVPARVQHAIGAAAPDIVRQWVVERELVGGLDWSRTPGFALRTDIRTELRVNLVGREAQGMLKPGAELHQRYVECVREAFLKIRGADSQASLVDEVVNIPELFPGPRSGALPDLAITWRSEPPVRRVYSPLVGSLSGDPSGVRGGDHTDFGFAVLLPGTQAQNVLPPLNETADFAAFVSALLGNAKVA